MPDMYTTWDCQHQRHDDCEAFGVCSCSCHDELWAALWCNDTGELS